MPTFTILLWGPPGERKSWGDTTCLSVKEKEAAVKGVGGLLSVIFAILLAADAASAFFCCLATLALVDVAVGTAYEPDECQSLAHIWWLAPLYLVFLCVLVPWSGFPLGGLDVFAFAESM